MRLKIKILKVYTKFTNMTIPILIGILYGIGIIIIVWGICKAVVR